MIESGEYPKGIKHGQDGCGFMQQSKDSGGMIFSYAMAPLKVETNDESV